MKTLAIDEPFLLSFNVDTTQREIYYSVISKILGETGEFTMNNVRGDYELTQFEVEVTDIYSAVNIMNKIYINKSLIDEAMENWKVGIISKKEYNKELNKFMA